MWNYMKRKREREREEERERGASFTREETWCPVREEMESGITSGDFCKYRKVEGVFVVNKSCDAYQSVTAFEFLSTICHSVSMLLLVC